MVEVGVENTVQSSFGSIIKKSVKISDSNVTFWATKIEVMVQLNFRDFGDFGYGSGTVWLFGSKHIFNFFQSHPHCFWHKKDAKKKHCQSTTCT